MVKRPFARWTGSISVQSTDAESKRSMPRAKGRPHKLYHFRRQMVSIFFSLEVKAVLVIDHCHLRNCCIRARGGVYGKLSAGLELKLVSRKLMELLLETKVSKIFAQLSQK